MRRQVAGPYSAGRSAVGLWPRTVQGACPAGYHPIEAPVTETRFRTCSLCEAMCGLAIEVEDGRVVSIRGDEDDVLSRGHICPKGVALKDLHEDPDRLR